MENKKFIKQFKKLNKYYSYLKWHKYLYNSNNVNIILCKINSFQKTNLFMLKSFILSHNLGFCFINQKFIGSVFIKLYDKNINSFKGLKAINSFINLPINFITFNNLKKLKELMLLNNNIQLQYLNLMYIKLQTHTKLCTFNYLLNNLFYKYGKFDQYSNILIIQLLKYWDTRLIKILKLNFS